MKRIVLGLSLLVMLAQNIFADKASYMKEYEGSKSVKALYKLLLCEAEVKFYKTEDANPEQCIEAANSILKGEDLGVLSKNKKTYLGEAYFNAGIIYQYKLHNHKQALECKFHKHSSIFFTFSLPLISQTTFHPFHKLPSTFSTPRMFFAISSFFS